jgi:hypothetical protein
MSTNLTSPAIRLLRLIIPINLLTVLLQAVWAGSFMSGNDTAVTLHLLTARVLIGLSMVQIGAAVYLRVRRECPPSIVASTIGVLLAEIIEIYSGYKHILVLHVPLAIGIFGGIMRQLFWVMREAKTAKAAV